jgi:DNA polymerase III delta prime subunit
MLENFLWTEKYRPKCVEDTVLPHEIKTLFKQFVAQKNVPNLLLSGGPGVGKTTVARAMFEELKSDYIIINGSMKGNIDTLRYDISNYASSVSFTGERKYVILDEADYLNANSTQPALRNFMEEFSKNCGFIMTCNFKNRIIEPLHSRCSVIDFKITKKEMPKLASQFFKKLCFILTKENVEYDPSVLAEVINKYFPDWRRITNEIQKYSATGKIDTGILANNQELTLKELVSFMKDRNYSEIRNWVSTNLDTDVNYMYRQFYDVSNMLMEKDSIPMLVLLIAKYQYQNSFAANSDINFLAFLTETMIECKFL